MSLLHSTEMGTRSDSPVREEHSTWGRKVCVGSRKNARHPTKSAMKQLMSERACGAPAMDKN